MIDFELSDEQAQLQSMVSAFLRDSGSAARLRAPDLVRPEAGLIAALAGLGLVGISVPETLEGQGLTLADECLVQREYGEHLAPIELLAASLGAIAAATAGDTELVASICRGETKIVLALPAPGGEMILAGSPLDALVLSWDRDGGRLLDGCSSVTSSELPGWDAGVAFHRLGADPSTPVAAFRGWTFAAAADTLLAAQLSGIAERTCRSAVDYAMVREQFGRVIGSFQAIKHRCADMKLVAAQAWAQTVAAAVAGGEGDPAFAEAAAMAKLVAARAALQNARSNIQIHGGMGFTEECDAHLFLKRTHLLDQLGGSVRDQKRRIAALLRSAAESQAPLAA